MPILDSTSVPATQFIGVTCDGTKMLMNTACLWHMPRRAQDRELGYGALQRRRRKEDPGKLIDKLTSLARFPEPCLQPSLRPGNSCGFDPVGSSQFADGLGEVIPHRPFGQVQLRRDVPAGGALGRHP